MKKIKQISSGVAMACLLLVMSILQVEPAEAKASKAAVAFLKGTWTPATMAENGEPLYYVRFTRSYRNCYEKQDGKLVLQSKVKIKSTKKLKNKTGYKIVLENGVYYVSDGKDTLWYWWIENGQKMMSGSDSLWRE